MLQISSVRPYSRPGTVETPLRGVGSLRASIEAHVGDQRVVATVKPQRSVPLAGANAFGFAADGRPQEQ
jgi:hypothetical protein